MNSITITRPDDWHLHFRDGELLAETVPATSRCFHRAIVMPNLVPPVINKSMALDYRERILSADSNASLQPLMTLYLTDQTTPQDIREAHSPQIPAAKLYPAGVTTNSDAAVGSIEHLYPVFEQMSEVGMRLLIHGEVTDPQIDIFDRELGFIDQYLRDIRERFPELYIVFEHITTSDAVDFVLQHPERTAATITPQHLLLNRNDLLVGGIRPHNYCLPVLKRSSHQQRLRDAAISGSANFFLGTDSAPHSRASKESACGCAGCYSAWGALELYAQVFDELGALDKLEGFASHFGADFYAMPRNQDTITLHREDWVMPELIEQPGQPALVPFFAGQTLRWKVGEPIPD